MIANVALAFLSAALLSGVGMRRSGRRITRWEIVASVLAAILLCLAFLDFVPTVAFYLVFVTSLLLNVFVCISQFQVASSTRDDPRKGFL